MGSYKVKSASHFKLWCIAVLATSFSCNGILRFLHEEISPPSRNIVILDVDDDINDNIDVSSMTTRAYSTDDVEETVEIEQQDLIVVLAMHRSGTSMITGLFVTSDIYDGGTELMKASRFNKKGYFEDEELVRQNIILMKDQNVREYRPTIKSTMPHLPHWKD